MEGGEPEVKARPAGEAICNSPSGRSACIDNRFALALERVRERMRSMMCQYHYSKNIVFEDSKSS